MCSDAFQYIWTKRQFIGELTRLVDAPEPGAVVINHTHNQLVWSPAHGQPLTPAGYQGLFETMEPRVFRDSALLADVVKGGPLDLSRRDSVEALDAEPGLTIVASDHEDVFTHHALDKPPALRGEYRLNPLYEVRREGPRLELRLRFPSLDYEEEFNACRQYLPELVGIEVAALEALQAGQAVPELAELVRRRVILDLPKNYC
jgi:hypothetical protein